MNDSTTGSMLHLRRGDLSDAHDLTEWLAERSIRVSFRFTADGSAIPDTFRDDTADEELAGPGSEEPFPFLFQVVVPDGRVRDGWRMTDQHLELHELAGVAQARLEHDLPIRFQPVPRTDAQ